MKTSGNRIWGAPVSIKKDIPSAVGSRTARGLGEVISGSVGENNGSIPPTLEGWVYIIPIYGPLDGPLYTWAQYTPTVTRVATLVSIFLRIEL